MCIDSTPPSVEVMPEAVRKDPESEYVRINPATGGPYADLKEGFSAACAPAAIRGLHWHDLRHTLVRG